MPFINSKITKKITREEEVIVKEKLGKAIELVPGPGGVGGYQNVAVLGADGIHQFQVPRDDFTAG